MIKSLLHRYKKDFKKGHELVYLNRGVYDRER